ncbi:TRAP transporter substrate-binding protein [Spartinivicinus poritis]|uniref:TRAP transporter substrate-binding protein n=1 Tax=Spartinivicinus poritis TaxID=2994640 RepID=A0ABT5UG61_9GAMM|nr:TRAP transporter substrate-binding protein [Spartinivicinus sp. A2-2]MDE1465364.1 TRAP transporter substrate-binding protein [Spartinivicinus sp. A2-2]
MTIRRSFYYITACLVLLLNTAIINAEVRWDMPTPYSDSTFHTRNIRLFADEILKATNNELNITVHSAGSLIKHPEIKKSVRRGIVPIGEVLMSRLSNEDSFFALDSIPYLATNYQQARKLWQASRKRTEEKLSKQGLKLLFSVPWQPQGLFAKKKVKAATDLQGLKLRVYNKYTERLAQLLQAIPTQIEAADIATAFSTGRVDSMITSPATGANTKAWDFLSHYHHFQAWIPKNMVIVNAKQFSKLNKDTQAVVLAAAKQAEERGWQMSEQETNEKVAVMKANGLKVVYPSDKLHSELSYIGHVMTKEWLNNVGNEGKSTLAIFKQ